ncbi:unnamed protein product [Clonostachys rhizophaga]|uniref:Zn(2)-C6 fungal-type domain-containing protein n=1 Tax=Clonostachys rhizophaga TaxID=160324 RepID=A0A9N9YIF8_9HYPO|nr:unnamed protein product [Clonostachys rhizophaga]
MAPPITDYPEPVPPRKRRRTALACEECRDRKRKCDGVKPICGACKGRSTAQCIWKQERNSKGWWSNRYRCSAYPNSPTDQVTKSYQCCSYVQELKSRIRELEDTQSMVNITDHLVDSTIPPSNREFGAPVSFGLHLEGSPASQDVVDDHEDAPADQGTPMCDDIASHGVNALEVRQPETALPLASAETAPIENASDQASALWAGMDFDSASKFLPSTRDSLEENGRLDMTDLEAGQPAMNAMGVVISPHGTAIRPARRGADYFGPSSTISLLREVRSVMGRRKCDHGPSFPGNPDRCSACEHNALLVTSESSPPSSTWLNHGYESVNPIFGMSLPPRPAADRFVDLFWTNMHSLYPFLHWPSFHHRYLTLWSPQANLQAYGTTDTLNGPVNGYYSTIDDALFHCMLNVVLALGVLHDTKIRQQERDEISETFFKRAKTLLDLDALESGSVALVQVLLLMGQYLQTRDITSSCWNIVGMAIRVAQGIGLHRESEDWDQSGSSSYRASEQLEEEMRRRAWAGCALLDRILSLTYGRPPMIHGSISHGTIVLPSAIDDDLLSRVPGAPRCQPSDTPSLVECYVHALKLQDILGQFLTSFYYQGSDNETASSPGLGQRTNNEPTKSQRNWISDAGLQKLLDVDRQLDTWNKDLPAHLQVHHYSEENLFPGSPRSSRSVIFCRQATVLKARYITPVHLIKANILRPKPLAVANPRRSLYVRMNLLRPSLSELCNSVSKTGLPSTQPDSINTSVREIMLIKSGNLCVSVAQELVSLITENSHARAHFLPPPWYNVLYIHGCALVLLLGSLCLHKVSDVEQHSLMADWDRCLTFLREYQSQSQSAPRCIRLLELLQQEASSYSNGTSLKVLPKLTY